MYNNDSLQGITSHIKSRAPFMIGRKGFEVILGIVTTAILARTLSKNQFAIYTLVFSMIAITRLTALPGLGTTISQSFAREKLGGFKKSNIITISGSIIGATILLGISIWYFNEGQKSIGQALLIAAFFFPFVTGITLWRNAAVGLDRFDKLAGLDALSIGLKTLMIILSAIAFPGALISILIASLGGVSLVNLGATYFQNKQIPADAKVEAGGIKYGIQTTIYQIPSVVSQHLDKFILFYFFSPEVLANYAIALRIPELVRMVVGESNATLSPLFSKAAQYTKNLRITSLKLTLVYGLFTVLGAVIVVPFLLPLIAGESYKEAVIYAQIMTVGVAFGYFGDIQFRYIKAHLHSKNFLSITLSKAFSDVIILFVFGYYFKFLGIVLAYGLRYLAFTVITTRVIKSRYMNFEKKT